MNSIVAKLLLVAPLVLCTSILPSAGDSDRDGISDKLEKQLLQKFFPRFHLSARECDGFPAEFQPGSQEPRPLKSNGTIYGQVFPVILPNRVGFYIEVHFYHLRSVPVRMESAFRFLWQEKIVLPSDQNG